MLEMIRKEIVRERAAVFRRTSFCAVASPLTVCIGVAFDDPKTGFSPTNIVAVVVFLTYPFGFVKAWRARRRALKDGADWCTGRNVGLLALPYAHFGVFFALFHFCGRNRATGATETAGQYWAPQEKRQRCSLYCNWFFHKSYSKTAE